MVPGSCSSRLRAGFSGSLFHSPSSSLRGALATKQSISRPGAVGLLRFARNDDCRLSPRPHQAALLPAPVAFLFALALVVQLLALGDRQQQLGAAALVEIEL